MFTKFKLYAEKGITLIELLIVSGVIAVLVTGVVVIINPLQKIGQANDSKRKADIAQLQRALEIYYQDNGQYPASTGSNSITDANWGDPWQPYMAVVPKDPSNGQNYVYYTPTTGTCNNYQCYYIYANLQRGKNDPQACSPGTGNACTNAVTYTLSNSCGGICNYGVSSPNTSP